MSKRTKSVQLDRGFNVVGGEADSEHEDQSGDDD
jgi:hypothetical protein